MKTGFPHVQFYSRSLRFHTSSTVGGAVNLVTVLWGKDNAAFINFDILFPEPQIIKDTGYVMPKAHRCEIFTWLPTALV